MRRCGMGQARSAIGESQSGVAGGTYAATIGNRGLAAVAPPPLAAVHAAEGEPREPEQGKGDGDADLVHG